MKKLLSVFLFLFCYVVAADAQDDAAQYDSIMNLMKNKKIPLMERYYMTGDIEHLSREHQIAVLKQLIPEAKEVEDKAVVTRLYSIVAMFENQLGHMAEAKNYLDSAFMNKGKFENNNIAGMMHYIAGIYYSDKNQMEKAHENYYQAADYFNRNAVKPAILTEIYYDLSIIYSMWQDDEGLNDLSEAMKDLPVDFPFQQILKLTIKAKYFYALYQNEHRMNLLDSVTKYNQEAFEVYTSTENPYDVGYVISDNYLHQAVVYSEAGKIKEAEQCFETGKKLMNPKKIDANVSLSYVSGVIAYYQADYELAEQHLQDGLHELKK